MSDHLLITIGNKIEGLRIEHNISREKLEENCGLKHQSIKKIERNPANTFNVSNKYFFLNIPILTFTE